MGYNSTTAIPWFMRIMLLCIDCARIQTSRTLTLYARDLHGLLFNKTLLKKDKYLFLGGGNSLFFFFFFFFTKSEDVLP